MAAALPLIATAGGTVLSASAQNQQGRALQLAAARRRAEAEFEAKQLDMDAGQAKAAAQREAQNSELQTKLITSKALALAAASGAGASDPTVMNIIAKTQGMGSYRAGISLYEGESQSRLDKMRATALRYGGDIGVADAADAAKASNTAATATLLSGGAKTASLFSKYWTAPQTGQTRTASGGTSWLDAGGGQIGDVG